MDCLSHINLQGATDIDFSKPLEEPFEIQHYRNILPYEDFIRNHLERNIPCIMKNSEKWPCMRWVMEDGSPNIQRIESEYNSVEVPVANCSSREFDSHPKELWSLGKFCRYWQHITTSDAQQKAYYLKDWHIAESGNTVDIYTCPVLYQSDWLNEWSDSRSGGQDYRFVYMGPKGTWTPLHHDVLKSYSWSANVCGKKRWLFVHPGDERYLRDERGEMCFDLRLSPGDARYPRAKLARIYEVEQNRGEIIFVPSGWYHQVHNEADTISINHNWINGFNIVSSWNHLISTLNDIEKEIQDLREMDGWHLQCQVILRSLTSVDFEEFTRFLFFIAIRRLVLLSKVCLKCVVVSFDEGLTDDLRKVASITMRTLADTEENGDPPANTNHPNLLCAQAHNFGRTVESGGSTFTSPECACTDPTPRKLCSSCTYGQGRSHVIFDAKNVLRCLDIMAKEERYSMLLSEGVVNHRLFHAIVQRLQSCLDIQAVIK